MFNSNILDVAIGMIFIYLLLSLMCSAANEIIELMLKKRAIDLERGIRELLQPGSKSGEPDIVQKLYDHALINNLFGGHYLESRIKTGWPQWLRFRRTQLPSYIPARNFALALMDLVALPSAPETSSPPASTPASLPAPQQLPSQPISGAADATAPRMAPISPAQFALNAPAGGGLASPPSGPARGANPPAPGTSDNPLTPLRTAIESNTLLHPTSMRALITLLDAAGGDVAKARENIENWFNSSMDRVSGWYKRRAQLTILVVGVFVAIAVNVDTITVAKRLATDKPLRESLVNAADAYSKANAQPAATPTPPSGANANTTSTPPAGASVNTTTAPASSVNANTTATPPLGVNANTAATPPSGANANTTATPPSSANAKTAATPPSGANANTTATPPSSANADPVADPTPTPTPALPECENNPTSDACETAKLERNKAELAKACADQDSDGCRREKAVQAACEDPNSDECKTARKLQIVCQDPNSFRCRRAEACTDPDSSACQRAKAVEKACAKPESPECKYLSTQQQIESLGLPIGWDDKTDPKRNFTGWHLGPGGWWEQFKWHWLGWLLTALAISLGAPFWFDLLNKFIVIRSAVKPHEKSPEEESKD